MIELLSISVNEFDGITTRHADIIISDGQTAYLWAVGNLPPEGDVLALLEAREAELWAAAVVGGQQISLEQMAREIEMKEAPLTARQFFANSPAAVDFVRMSPVDQAAAIDAMALAQLKTVVKFLAVAVSAAIKREFL